MNRPRLVEVVGDVVRRPAEYWTETVQTLLQHLFNLGLPVPEPLGVEAGVETVRFIRGAAGDDCWPHQVSVASVRSAGMLLRAVHEATTSWTPPHQAVWAVPAEDTPDGVICHGDPKPPNMAWRRHRAVGLIDWDDARPATRLSDVAYAITWIAPFFEDDAQIRERGLASDVDVMARAEAFLDGYGWSEPIDIRTAVTARRKQAIAEVVYLGGRGMEPAATWVHEGWPQRWLDAVDAHPQSSRSPDHPADDDRDPRQCPDVS